MTTTNIVARSPGRSLRGRMEQTGPFTKAADKLESSLRATALKALKLAGMHRRRERIYPKDELPETAQDRLNAAAIGSLGVSSEVAELCKRALHEWETALRERADYEARTR